VLLEGVEGAADKVISITIRWRWPADPSRPIDTAV